jgi:hypothetical protein
LTFIPFQITLENSFVDELLYFMTDCKSLTSNLSDIEQFSRFFTLYGEVLYILSSFMHQYFQSRIPQFFNLFKIFVDSIFFYKNDAKDEFTENEIDLLLKLTLQMEKLV